MSRKASIYKGDTLIKLEADLSKFCDSKITRVVNTVCDRYQELISRFTPKLKKNEWLFIMDAMNGYPITDLNQSVRGMEWSISDAVSEGKTAGGKVSSQFALDFRDLYFMEKVAVLHIVQTFWATKAEDGEEYRALLERVGAKII